MTSAPIRNDSDFIQSASVTAMMRSLLSHNEGQLKNPDTIAKHYVSLPWKDFLDNPEDSYKYFQNRVPGCIYYHLVRTKKIDASLLKWADKNPNGQVIILGSGFDSRSIRFRDKLKNITFYEFDLKGMLDYKINIINSNTCLNANKNVTYIDINLHKESLIDKLTAFNVNKNIPTYILWEGVSYFLEEDTVVKTLENMTHYFINTLNVIFDYAYKDYIKGDLSYYGAVQLANELRTIGEPHIFGINPDDVSIFLRNLNYQVLDNSPAKELEKQFLLDVDGSIITNIHGFHGIVECIKS